MNESARSKWLNAPVIVAACVTLAESVRASRFAADVVEMAGVGVWIALTIGSTLMALTVLRDLLHARIPERWWGRAIDAGIAAWAAACLFLVGFGAAPDLFGVSVLGVRGPWPPNPTLLTLMLLCGGVFVGVFVLARRGTIPQPVLGLVVALAAFFALRDLAGTSARQLAAPYTAAVLAWCVLAAFVGRPGGPIRRRLAAFLLLPALAVGFASLPTNMRLVLTKRLVFTDALIFSPVAPADPVFEGPCVAAAPESLTAEVGRARGVVVVVVDTLRHDRVTPALMPHTSRFGEQASLKFDRVYTPAPSTDESFRAMFGLRQPDGVLPRLTERGVRIEAVPAHPGVAALLPPEVTLDRRAMAEEDYRFAVTSELVTDVALERLGALREGEAPFVLLVHYYDPHEYYVENAAFDFGGSRSARYDAEVAYTDRALGRLLDAVRDSPDVGTIVTSDHGEELWDHGYVSHSRALYDESTRVFLAMSAPGAVAATVEATTSNHVVGALLWAALTDGTFRWTAEPVRLHKFDAHGVVVGDHKAIWNRESRIGEVYDLSADPGEQRNLYDERGFPAKLCAESLVD